MPSSTRSVVTALVVAVAAAHMACASGQGPRGGRRAVALRSERGVLAISSADEPAQIDLRAPARGTGSAVARGAAEGAVVGTLAGAWVGLKLGVGAGMVGAPVAGAAIAAASTTVGLTVGVLVGAIRGAAAVPPAVNAPIIVVQAADLQRTFEDELKDRVAQTVGSRTAITAVVLGDSASLSPAHDRVLEIHLRSLHFRARGFAVDPPLELFVEARARLIHAADGREPHRYRTSYRAGPRPFAAWAAHNAQPVREALAQAVARLGDDIVSVLVVSDETLPGPSQDHSPSEGLR